MLHEGLESLVGVESFERRFRRKMIPSRTELSHPGFIEPAIVSRIERVPSGGRRIHQIKFNGYRVQAHLHNSEVRVFIPPP
jgi:bifunctional non-homologous end joining protein LigD